VHEAQGKHTAARPFMPCIAGIRKENDVIAAGAPIFPVADATWIESVRIVKQKGSHDRGATPASVAVMHRAQPDSNSNTNSR
jgi:hypothetical protein